MLKYGRACAVFQAERMVCREVVVCVVGLFFVNFYLCQFATSDSGVPPELAKVNEVVESGSLKERRYLRLERLVSMQVAEVGKLTLYLGAEYAERR